MKPDIIDDLSVFSLVDRYLHQWISIKIAVKVRIRDRSIFDKYVDLLGPPNQI